MNRTEPMFSIIIPTYNRKDLIESTIQSIWAQNTGDYELIVVDDGSTDGTAEWLRQKYPELIQIISVQNGERGRARNIGVQHSSGAYIYFLDSDDRLYPDHLTAAQEFIRKNGDIPWFFQEYEVVPHPDTPEGQGQRPIYHARNPVKTLVCEGNFMSCHGVFLRRDIAEQHPFPEDRAMAGSEDYALWLALAARYPLLVHPVVTSALVQHESRSVFNFSAEKLIERKELMLRHVLADPRIRSEFRPWLHRLKANSYGYVSLHLAMIGNKKLAWKYGMRALRHYPPALLTRRFGATIKRLMLG